jgi:hypothetical protein
MGDGAALDVGKHQSKVLSAKAARWARQFPLAQGVHKERRHGNAACSGFALGRSELSIAIHALSDVEDAIVEVDVRPSEAAHLTGAKASEDEGDYHWPPAALGRVDD